MNILQRAIVWFWMLRKAHPTAPTADMNEAAFNRTRAKNGQPLTMAERVVNAEILVRIAEKAQPGSFVHIACMEALCLTPQQVLAAISPEAMAALEEWEIPALLAEDRPRVN